MLYSQPSWRTRPGGRILRVQRQRAGKRRTKRERRAQVSLTTAPRSLRNTYAENNSRSSG